MSQQESLIKSLEGKLETAPSNWETRKSLALLYYDTGRAIEATDLLWSAPEIPSTDVDIAFVIKIAAGCKPNRVIRLVYELLAENADKPSKIIAIANALNAEGLYLLAARFYGAAVAKDNSFFDLSFEKQSLWMDDSKKIKPLSSAISASEPSCSEANPIKPKTSRVEPVTLIASQPLSSSSTQLKVQRRPPVKPLPQPVKMKPPVSEDRGE